MRGLLLFEYGPFASFLRSTVSTELMKTFIKSISKYPNNGQKKKRKIKIDNFLRKITTRIFRYYTRLLLESRFHPNSDNLDNGLVNFFPNFSSKKNMIDVSGLKVIIKCILHFIVNVCNLFRVKRREEGEERGGLLRKVFSPGFRFQARWLESLSKRWKRKLENYAKKQRINF